MNYLIILYVLLLVRRSVLNLEIKSKVITHFDSF